jgi:type IV secretion system protein VirB10
MSSVQKPYSAAFLIGLMVAGLSLCAAQTPVPPSPDQSAPAPATTQPATPPASSPAAPAAPAQPAAPAEPADAAATSADPVGLTNAAPAKKTYTVPAGTKVLLELRSSINTKSAKPGDGVYLSSTFPVVVGNRVMIPTGVYVQGVVDRVQRGGMRAKAQLDMHFTSIIFPNGTVAEIPGVVDSVPGSKNQTVMNDGEGTIQQNGDKGRNAGRTAEIALPSGAGVGTIGGAESGHPIEGGLAGLGAGLATVGIVSLFTRNADVDIPRGTQVEMVLQRPLVLEDENLAGLSEPGNAPELVPAANQQRPITNHRPRIMCPPGSLGCE